MTSPELSAFDAKFRSEALTVATTEHWRWAVRPMQPMLGSGILSLRRHAPRFSDVSSAENADLSTIVATIERATKDAFGYDKINYLMLMMVDEHVHFHVLPRYEAPRAFEGIEWTDASWPGPPSLGATTQPDSVLFAIRDALRAAL